LILSVFTDCRGDSGTKQKLARQEAGGVTSTYRFFAIQAKTSKIVIDGEPVFAKSDLGKLGWREGFSGVLFHWLWNVLRRSLVFECFGQWPVFLSVQLYPPECWR
jgi:hypothetical protein